MPASLAAHGPQDQWRFPSIVGPMHVVHSTHPEQEKAFFVTGGRQSGFKPLYARSSAPVMVHKIGSGPVQAHAQHEPF
jgi:hypothetical protein